MNDADSKKLGALNWQHRSLLREVGIKDKYLKELQAKVKEQDREIAGLREEIDQAWKSRDMHCEGRQKAEAELAKWTRKHDNVDLQALREQAAGSYSLAAQGAYINGLEVHLRQAEARVEQLEKLYRHTHVGPDRMCAECELDLTDSLHVRAVLAEKEKE